MDRFKTIVKYLAIFIAGFIMCWVFFPRTVPKVEYKDKIIKGDAQTITKTEVVYVPKEINSFGQREKTDLQVDIAKTDINVKVNGKDAVISKADDEQYMFEKNKIALQQTSKAEINIKVPVQDRTRYWSLGVGYGNNGVAGMVGFPISKKAAIGGWVYADKRTGAGGIEIKF